MRAFLLFLGGLQIKPRCTITMLCLVSCNATPEMDCADLVCGQYIKV